VAVWKLRAFLSLRCSRSITLIIRLPIAQYHTPQRINKLEVAVVDFDGGAIGSSSFSFLDFDDG
jgi:hypothetical protein